jgi:hypothetical protein
MPVKPVKFVHKVIDPDPAGWENDVTLIADVNGDGFNDIIIGSKFDPGPDRSPGTGNLVWYEYPRWNRHTIGCGELEAGGVVTDLTGNARPDIIIGEQIKRKDLWWWENPEDPTQRWTRRLITDRFEKYHDQAIGDVDGDGEDELVFLSQRSKILAYFDIPPDPRVEPWPAEYCHIIAEDVLLEGLRVADIDGDGVNEIIAGANYFKHEGDASKPWKHVVLIDPFDPARTVVADINGDGHLDIVLAEGESNPAKLVWCEGPDFKKVHTLREDLFNPHSLEVADFNNTGTLDIFVGEMNLKDQNPDAKLYIYLNDGKGHFDVTEIDCPQGTHEAKVADIGNTGRISIVGKPYLPHNQVDLWENVTE